MSFLVSVLMVIVLGIGSVFGFYNSLVSARENVDSKWSQVDNQLQRRSDLVPNLVNTVKGYASHEKEVFQAVSAPASRAFRCFAAVAGLNSFAKSALRVQVY